MCKNSYTSFYNLTVLALGRLILMMRVRTRHMMRNAKRAEKGVVNFMVFPSLIRLDTFDFSIQNTFNMSLKL
jgi:hypothetical protein